MSIYRYHSTKAIDFVCRQATGFSFETLQKFSSSESKTELRVREWALRMRLRLILRKWDQEK